jgi:thioredoxin 1
MNSDQTIKIDGMNWKDEVLKAELPVVIEFFSPICPYCRQLTPVFQKLSEEYIQKMKFGMVDTSKNNEIASGYGSSYFEILLYWSPNIRDRRSEIRKRTERRTGEGPKYTY